MILPCTRRLHIAVLLGDRHWSSVLGVPRWPKHVHTTLEIQQDLCTQVTSFGFDKKTSVASAARLLEEFSAALKFLQSMSIQQENLKMHFLNGLLKSL